jgi:hypothetical protein
MTAPVIEPVAFNPLNVKIEIGEAQTPRLSATDDVPREWLGRCEWWAITLRIGPLPTRETRAHDRGRAARGPRRLILRPHGTPR